MRRILVLWFLVSAVGVAPGADWPQWLGPSRNGVSPETNFATTWPKEGPRVAWRKEVGQGWSGPVVASNRVVIFHRLGGSEVVECVRATNGAPVWRSESPTQYRDDFGFEEGPRGTPSIDGGRVFTFGAEGALAAWSFEDGRKLWRVETQKEFHVGKGFFGVACSPLVEGGAVILNVGGTEGAGVVAFEAESGRVRWKATQQGASCSSATAATVGGRRLVLVLGRTALVALDASSGRVLWEHPFRPRIQASVTAATPLVVAEQGTNALVFLSASYGAGAALLGISASGAKVVWSRDDVLSNHYGTSVQDSGSLIGFDGRQEQRCHLRGVDWRSGKVLWSEDHFGAGTLLRAGGKLLVLGEGGELILAPAGAGKFQPLARAQILGSDCRALPALADGLFYARDKRQLVCVDLRAR